MAARGPSTRSLQELARRLVAGPPGRLHALTGSRRRATATAVRMVVDPDELIGVTADDSWWGVALVLPGRARPVDDPLPTTTIELGPPTRSRASIDSVEVTVCYVVDRSGAGAFAIRRGDDVEVAGDRVSGLVADIARRVLGARTPDESTSTSSFVVSAWLRRLLDVVADPTTAHQVTRWSDAVALHPAIVGSIHPTTLGPDELAHLTVQMARAIGWPRLRELAMEGGVDVAGLDPSHVAWMDWPFFARWMLSVHRPVTELLDDLSLFIDGALLRDLRYTVDAVGWLGFAGPGAEQPTGDG